jgi:hypothetical protein
MTVLNIKDISKKLNKSLRWCYEHAQELGAARIGGSWIFTEEGLHNAIQTGQELARSSSISGKAVSGIKAYETRSSGMGKRQAQGAEREREEAAARHGLDDLLH